MVKGPKHKETQKNKIFCIGTEVQSTDKVKTFIY